MPDKQYTKVSFYVVAHADDWQLFMQPNALNDLVASGSKVVFIITTAGDAGAGEAFWAAREEGMKSSLRFCLAPFANLFQLMDNKNINSHTINYWSANNANCYFLRLPDGNLNGGGFSENKFYSLKKLSEGKINTVIAVDNSAIYHSWPDFYTTLQAIILSESKDISDIIINYLNPDTNANPDDHADHIATGRAIQAMPVISGMRQALFVGYSVNNVSDNLDATDLFWKAGMFAAYEKAVFDGSGYSTLQENTLTYLKWCLSNSRFIIINA